MFRFQPDLSTQAAEQSDVQKFDDRLKVSDAALTGMDPEAYKSWIKIMIAGIVALAYQCRADRAACRSKKHSSRAVKSFNRRMETIEKWREDSKALVKSKDFTWSRHSTRLNVRHRFACTADLLRGGTWYLVSLLHKKEPAKHWAD